MLTNHPLLETRPATPAVMLALLAGIISFAAMAAILFQELPPTGWYNDHAFPATLNWLLPYLAGKLQDAWNGAFGMNPFDRLSWAMHSAFTQTFLAFDLTSDCVLRLAVALLTAIITSLTAGMTYYLATEPVDAVKHISGRRLWRGHAAIIQARQALRRAIGLSGPGLSIAPGLTIGRSHEVEHIGIFGTTGAGKSVIARWLANQTLKRGDKIIFHDSKGDVTACLPTSDFILLAPQNQHSYAWDVAADMISMQDARELATRLIPDSHDPMWAAAAREVLTGIIVYLQRNSPGFWTWQDLFDAAFLPAGQLVSLLETAYPSAARFVELTPEGHPTRTSFGILVNTWAELASVVRPLADAWGQCPPAQRLSLRRWLADCNDGLPKVLVLQRSPRYPALSAAWIGAAIDCIASTAASPELPDSQSRRIWLMLDEFPQLGKLRAFRQLLEVGRAKGIACVLAMQDSQQLAALYGDAESKTILTLLGQKIIGRMPAGPSAAMIADELVGKRDVAWKEASTSYSDGKTTRTWQTHRATVPVFPVEQLERRLGVDRKGVRALLLGHGDVYELRWPLLFWPRLRAATQPRGEPANKQPFGVASAAEKSAPAGEVTSTSKTKPQP